MGLGNASQLFAWAIPRALSSSFFKMARSDTGRFPAYVSYGFWPSQGTGRLSYLCAYGYAASTAAQAPIDLQTMYLKGPWQCQLCD
jgi:hypothetical protein